MAQPVVPFLARHQVLAGLWARQKEGSGLETVWRRLPYSGRFFVVAYTPSWRPFAFWLLREAASRAWQPDYVRELVALFGSTSNNPQKQEVTQ